MPKRLFNVRDLWTGRPIKPPNNKISQLNQLQSHIVESNALKLFNKNTEVTVTSRTSFQSNSLNIAEVTHPFPRVPSAPAPVEESGHLMFGKAERWLEIVYMSHKQSGWRERLYNFFHFQSGVWKQRAGASVTSGRPLDTFLFPGGLIPSCFYASYMFWDQSLNVYSTRQKPCGTTFSIRLLPALDGFLTITSHFSPHNLESQTVTFLYFYCYSEQPRCLFNPKTNLITNE